MSIDALIQTLVSHALVLRPELTVAVGLMLVLVLDVVLPRNSHKVTVWATILVFLAALVLLPAQALFPMPVFADMIAVDEYAVFFKAIFLIAGIITAYTTLHSAELERNNRRIGEFMMVLIGLVLGLMLMAGATNLLMMVVSMELVSLSSYVLVSYLKENKASNEAGLKYVIYGAVSSGIMLYGISLFYGITGTLSFTGINDFFRNPQSLIDPVTLTLASLMVLAGLGFKIAAVPFHFWSPDAYEGAPTPVAAFLSVAPKAAGFALLLRFFKTAFFGYDTEDGYTAILTVDWVTILGSMAVLTMSLGNLTALWQLNVKRLLAYSSIAHAGYILMGVILLTDSGQAAMLFYLAYYLIMNLGVFYVAMLIGDSVGSYDMEDWKGFGYRNPILGVSMVIFLASLVGIPGTVGFAGKFLLFVAVLQEGNLYFWLAIVAVVNSVISAFYYFKIAKMMFLKAPLENNDRAVTIPLPAVALTLALAIPTILLGLYWQPLYQWSLASIRMWM